jgi:O-antigen/teichoic acid export membrane protein
MGNMMSVLTARYGEDPPAGHHCRQPAAPAKMAGPWFINQMQPLKIRSIKLNFVLNNTRLLLNLLIPLAVFPYVSRTLGPEGLGKVEFANSIVSYFVLLTALGIPTYGMREIARRRDDSAERSRVVWELTLILAVTIVIGCAVYFTLVRFVPFLHKDRILFCVMAPAIILSDFSYEWFYGGIEDQVYITIRFIAAKAIQVLLVFLCVKNAGDFIIYAGIAVGLSGFSTVFNVARLKRYVYFVPPARLNIRRHIKPLLLIFSSTAAVNVYMHLDVTMIGIMADDAAVGLYTAANKIIRIVISLVTSIGAVMVPRLENALNRGDAAAYKSCCDKSLRFILIFGAPCCFGIASLAPEITELFAGGKYLDSILSVRLLAPVIVIVGLAHFVGLQILYTNRKEKQYAIAVSAAAAANAVFNLYMIPLLRQNGAILGTLLAELTGLGIQTAFAWKLLKDTELFTWNTVKYFIAAAVMAFVVFLVRTQVASLAPRVIASLGAGVFSYAFLLVLLREKTVCQVYSRYKKRFPLQWPRITARNTSKSR